MEIKREKYLNDLVIRMNNGLIKVVTGIRRCGKSYLIFNLFYKYLLSVKVEESCIIRLALDDDLNENLREPSALSAYIRSAVADTGKNYYILLDEIQFAISDDELKNPDKPKKIYSVLNGLLRLPNVDIYVTGSNSRFLSTDVMTEFRGRGDEIHILPFTFSEFMQGYSGDIYHGWAEYTVYGGLPLILSMQTDEQKSNYLQHLLKETYLKDIIARNKIGKSQELNDLMLILASAAGSLTNPTKIVQTFKSIVNSSISINTVLNYIDYLKDAFILTEVNRYDIKGRKYIGSPNKYYFEDIGLRNSLLNFRQTEENHIMENIIYNELRFRGYNIDVGIVEKRTKDASGKEKRNRYEVDFVATQGSKKYYLQSAFALPSSEKEQQEKLSLQNIGDNFKKIIVVKDVIKPQRDNDGITTIGLFDFLLNGSSLEL
jgi:Predicted ATPase (AAA+ superfamily)